MKQFLDEVKNNPDKEWGKIKEIICGVADALNEVCDMLPDGMIKKIVCGLAAMLSLICSILPDNA